MHQLLVLRRSVVVRAALLLRTVSLGRVLVGAAHVLRQRGVSFRNRTSRIGNPARREGMSPDVALGIRELLSARLHPVLPMEGFVIDYALIIPASNWGQALVSKQFTRAFRSPPQCVG